MKMNLYSVHDKIAGVWNLPMYFMNDAVAQRTMENCVANPEHPYGLNPEDYELWLVGVYDDTTGHVELLEALTPAQDGMPQKPVRRKILDLVTLKREQGQEIH